MKDDPSWSKGLGALFASIGICLLVALIIIGVNSDHYHEREMTKIKNAYELDKLRFLELKKLQEDFAKVQFPATMPGELFPIK